MFLQRYLETNWVGCTPCSVAGAPRDSLRPGADWDALEVVVPVM